MVLISVQEFEPLTIILAFPHWVDCGYFDAGMLVRAKGTTGHLDCHFYRVERLRFGWPPIMCFPNKQKT
jgi:hypothetical protein